MSSWNQPGPPPSPVPADRLAEAGVWVARLHGDARDAAMEQGFRRWLSAHPLNGQAFEIVTEVWEEAGQLRRIVPVTYEPPRSRRNHLRVVTVTLAMAAVVLLSLPLWPTDIRTGVGEQRQLTLEDGSRIHLNTETRLVVRYRRDRRDIELKTGEALFDVAHDPDRPFTVTAGGRSVAALGTSFVVRHDVRRTEVLLVTGKVAVSMLPGHLDTPGTRLANAVTLQPGQRVRIMDRLPARIDTPPVEAALAWRRGQVVLDATPLRDAIAEMNRYSALRLDIEDAEMAELPIDGLFQAGDSVSFANAVAQAYGLVLEQRDDGLVLRTRVAPGTAPPAQ